MNEIEVEKILLLLKRSGSIQFADECYKSMKHDSRFIVGKGICMNKKHVYEVYKTRSELQVNVTKADVHSMVTK